MVSTTKPISNDHVHVTYTIQLLGKKQRVLRCSTIIMSNILLAESHDSVDHIVVVLTESLHGSSASALSLLHDEGNIIGVQTCLKNAAILEGSTRQRAQREQPPPSWAPP